MARMFMLWSWSVSWMYQTRLLLSLVQLNYFATLDETYTIIITNCHR